MKACMDALICYFARVGERYIGCAGVRILDANSRRYSYESENRHFLSS